jgi:hypothetical protein
MTVAALRCACTFEGLVDVPAANGCTRQAWNGR